MTASVIVSDGQSHLASLVMEFCKPHVGSAAETFAG